MWIRWVEKRNKHRLKRLQIKKAAARTKDYIEKNKPGWVK